MSTWNHCIVSYFDLIGIKKELNSDKPTGIDTMMQMHQAVHEHIMKKMPYHENAYYWNDSVLLLAFVDESKNSYQQVMKEVNQLKKEINKISNSYVICVKGMAIPPPFYRYNDTNRSIYLKVSSMALANCFTIEKELGKKYKRSWYIDSRIAKQIKTKSTAVKDIAIMLPTNRKRHIFMYNDDLW